MIKIPIKPKMGRRKYRWFIASNNSLRICREAKWSWKDKNTNTSSQV